MMQNKKKEGLAKIAANKTVPYRFLDGKLTLFLGGSVTTLNEDDEFILGQEFDKLVGGYTRYHLSTPIENYGSMGGSDKTDGAVQIPISIGNVNVDIDYYIDNYCDRSLYNQMRFSFAELDYFIPSSSISMIDKTSIAFSREPIELNKFEFLYDGVNVSFILRIYSIGNIGVKCNAETKSELLVQFEKTDNMAFLTGLYQIIHDLFAFLCNRHNISLDSVILIGEQTVKHSTHTAGKVVCVDKVVPTDQRLVLIDKYAEEAESEKVSAKIVRYNQVSSHFEGLFSLILSDSVSLSSIHTSVKARNYFDLKQCLHITASFEFYERTLLPKISSQTTLDVYKEVQTIISAYVESLTGKKKKKAESLLNGLAPMLSLKDKIVKVYRGYSTWISLEEILDEWFFEQVDDLAAVANIWRNELAHEKRSYEPDERVVSAIRLVEHLNYCIVLRQAGFSNSEIKPILEQVLKR